MRPISIDIESSEALPANILICNQPVRYSCNFADLKAASTVPNLTDLNENRSPLDSFFGRILITKIYNRKQLFVPSGCVIRITARYSPELRASPGPRSSYWIASPSQWSLPNFTHFPTGPTCATEHYSTRRSLSEPLSCKTSSSRTRLTTIALK